ncbi:sulfopyruvate decarboxylase subunit beta [Methanolobus halotolerans]|uniref:sulfopyruvate decarboxylase n=1 Tax=Methanolobus halotolerans TaxID=2052935 RepID=A0A4E0PXX9_9EURY|nr:sulfopyruvate decarboxylase subunit beta [Methanolobus halotolerans]TGC10994.1 sulfopyruvate decarboxylase subunit beta [Methanolobus halotolerans]
MKRMDAISEIVKKATNINALLVSNIGVPCKELHQACDTPNNFYMLGSMGLASSIGLGLALALSDRKVIAIDGDGSVLMNMGSLATIAWQAPDNYLLVVVDNGAYGSTGNQPTATSQQADLAQVAKGAGNIKVYEAGTKERLRQILQETDDGIIVVRVLPGNADVPNIQMSPEDILERFMAEASRPSGSV